MKEKGRAKEKEIILFTPIKLGKVEVRNRVAFAPMGTGLYSTDGTVTEETLPYIEARARGGVGLIISQFTAATKFQRFPLMVSFEDRLIPSLRSYADAAHRYGAKVFLQIATMGGADLLGSYAPSAIDLPWYSILPKELTREQIREVIEGFIQAALRAKKAGFDGVELHGAYGYLIAEFISPFSNRRKDEYGGDFEGRMRVPVEIVRGIRDVCGGDFPVGFKFNAYEDVPGGIDLELSVRIANKMVDEGVVYLHPVTMATGLSTLGLSKYPAMPILYHPIDVTIPVAEHIKSHLKDTPVLAAGGIKDPAFAEAILNSGKADMVVLGRALLADPDWVNNSMAGRRVRPCLRCNVCHFEAVAWVRKIVCTVNPYLMREPEEPLKRAPRRKRVMVVGGGPAGIMASLVASKRGHEVTLYEKGNELGGLLIPGSRPPFKADVLDLLNYLREEISESDVEVRLKEEVTPEKVRHEAPDALIVAIGANPIRPPIKGLEKARVLYVTEALLNPEKIGNEPLIVGGGVTGCETALYLRRLGKSVMIVEKLPELMPLEEEGYKYNTAVLTKMLKEEGVRALCKSEVVEVTPSSAFVRFGGSRPFEVSADTIILAVGLKAERSLVEPFRASCKESYVIGDCESPRRIRDAIFEGDKVARLI
ncbi:MAG: FAD-dependent oxidoreductase [Candidatus Bathyarchaeia archaeon]